MKTFIRLSTALVSNVDKRAVKCMTLLLFVVFLSSCGGGNNAPDVSGIKVQLKTQRFDRAFASIDTNQVGASLQKLHDQFPEFLDFYLDTLMGLGVHGNYSDTAAPVRLGVKSFLTHKDYRGLLDTINAHYPDTKDLDAQLTKGFQYQKYYFPQSGERRIIYISGWLGNIGAFTYGDNIIGVGLDMFLGASYPYYKSVGIPEYWSVQLNKDYIPVAVFKTLYREQNPFRMQDANLLDMMIQRGKEAYYIDKVLPFLPESVKLAYTQKQLDWCNKNEGQVYNFFVTQNYLFETSWQKIVRYVNEGPNSAGMGDDSPGNIGTWVGLQIVKAYMNEHPKMTLADLIKQHEEPQTFLRDSKYKPK
jgi:hypothetical protein